jgi:uncharacterized membrane protein
MPRKQPPDDADSQGTANDPAYHRSTLPPASELERIEKLMPGATARIMAMVEKQQDHRMHWEKAAWEGYDRERRRAQFCALVFALSGLATALVLGILNQPTAATVIGSATIGGVVASFIGVRGAVSDAKSLLGGFTAKASGE